MEIGTPGQGRPNKKVKEGKETNNIHRAPPIIHVIAGGIASGGDTNKGRRQYSTKMKFPIILQVDKKRPREGSVISFSDQDS